MKHFYQYYGSKRFPDSRSGRVFYYSWKYIRLLPIKNLKLFKIWFQIEKNLLFSFLGGHFALSEYGTQWLLVVYFKKMNFHIRNCIISYQYCYQSDRVQELFFLPYQKDNKKIKKLTWFLSRKVLSCEDDSRPDISRNLFFRIAFSLRKKLQWSELRSPCENSCNDQNCVLPAEIVAIKLSGRGGEYSEIAWTKPTVISSHWVLTRVQRF
jgi:hypothetical protein